MHSFFRFLSASRLAETMVFIGWLLGLTTGAWADDPVNTALGNSLAAEPAASESVQPARQPDGLVSASRWPVEPSLGLGGGWPYGGVGANLEALLGRHLAVFGGWGTVFFFDAIREIGFARPPLRTGWNAGLRYYFGDPESRLSGRIGFAYGSASIIKEITSDFEAAPTHQWVTINGYHPSLGGQWYISRHLSLNLDFEFVIPAERYRNVEYPSQSVSFGPYVNTYGPVVTKTQHIEIPAYPCVAFGVIYHFGDHGREAAAEDRVVAANLPEVTQGLVKLRSGGIVVKANRDILFTGQIVNDGTDNLEQAMVKITYRDASGNSVAAEEVSLLDLGAYNPNSALRPGYSRKFVTYLSQDSVLESSPLIEFSSIQTCAPPQPKVPIEPSLGFGLGWPYGGAGVNAEALFYHRFALSAGGGSLILFDAAQNTSDDELPPRPGWNVGAHYYFGDPDARLRGRIGFSYGSSAVIMKITKSLNSQNFYEFETIPGCHPNAGVQYFLSRHLSLNLDVEYVMPSEKSRDIQYFWQTADYDYVSSTYTYGPLIMKTQHIDIPNYVFAALGITYHFGDYSQKAADVKNGNSGEDTP